jgi:hypothetical protein
MTVAAQCPNNGNGDGGNPGDGGGAPGLRTAGGQFSDVLSSRNASRPVPRHPELCVRGSSEAGANQSGPCSGFIAMNERARRRSWGRPAKHVQRAQIILLRRAPAGLKIAKQVGTEPFQQTRTALRLCESSVRVSALGGTGIN